MTGKAEAILKSTLMWGFAPSAETRQAESLREVRCLFLAAEH